MVRRHLTSAGADEIRSLNANVSRTKTKFAGQRKLQKDQSSIQKSFGFSQVQQSAERDLTNDVPSNKCYPQDYFESRYKDIIITVFENPPTSLKTDKNLLPGSPLHRIQLKSKKDLHMVSFKINRARVNIKSNEHLLPNLFPIRRSKRKSNTIVQEEKQKSLEEQLRSGVEDGLKMHSFNSKGRGVVATKCFSRGDFVVEYSGELLDMVQAKQREEMYAQDTNTGCYMYYFKYQNRQYCIDATAETGRLGRLINHSRSGNLITQTVTVETLPRLVLIAKECITVGEELSYDYGDRSKKSIKHHPWLAF